MRKILNPRRRILEKLWNSYVRFPLPWRFRHSPHKHWEGQSVGDGHGPDKFLEMTHSSEVLVAEIQHCASGFEARILDLGCNVGRHLNTLWMLGFRQLWGVDIQSSALTLMAEKFSEMKCGSIIQRGTFQDYLPSVSDRFFEITYTQGATIELVPPTFPICQEMARVSSKYVIIAISESDHYYPRLWEYEFLRAKFILTKMLRPITSDSQATLMVFNRIED